MRYSTTRSFKVWATNKWGETVTASASTYEQACLELVEELRASEER